jgi:hypothetical protein
MRVANSQLSNKLLVALLELTGFSSFDGQFYVPAIKPNTPLFYFIAPFTGSFLTTFSLIEIPMKDGPIRPLMVIDNPTNNFHLNISLNIFENHYPN